MNKVEIHWEENDLLLSAKCELQYCDDSDERGQSFYLDDVKNIEKIEIIADYETDLRVDITPFYDPDNAKEKIFEVVNKNPKEWLEKSKGD